MIVKNNYYQNLLIAFEQGNCSAELLDESLNLIAPALTEEEERRQVLIALNNSEDEQWMQAEILSQYGNAEESETAKEQIKIVYDKLLKGLVDKVVKIFKEDELGINPKELVWHYRMSYGIQFLQDQKNKEDFCSRTKYTPEQTEKILEIVSNFYASNALTKGIIIDFPEHGDTEIVNILATNSRKGPSPIN